MTITRCDNLFGLSSFVYIVFFIFKLKFKSSSLFKKCKQEGSMVVAIFKNAFRYPFEEKLYIK